MKDFKAEKRCWNCLSKDMVPTEETHGLCRMFKCKHCGAKFLWLDKPEMNGAHAEKHAIKGGGYSGMSMLNDPECNVFFPAKYPPPPTKRELRAATLLKEKITRCIDGKLFRWHMGKEEWILIIIKK